MTEKPELGDEVRDIISGIQGIVVGVTKYLYGCTRLIVQSKGAKDGTPCDNFWVDEPQVKIVKKGVVDPSNRAVPAVHGPRPEPRDNRL